MAKSKGCTTKGECYCEHNFRFCGDWLLSEWMRQPPTDITIASPQEPIFTPMDTKYPKPKK